MLFHKVIAATKDEVCGLAYLSGTQFHYNKMPRPFVLSDIHDLYHEISIYSPRYLGYLQVTEDDEGNRIQRLRQFRLVLFDDRGYAIEMPADWTCRKRDEHPLCGIEYTKLDQVRFYRIGCTHPNMTTTWPRMHDRHDDCPDCGFHAVYDTSG